MSYNDFNAREILTRWVDQPQQLWKTVLEVLNSGVQTVVHVGPAPNILPATFHRLAENVETQTEGKLHMRALTSIRRTPLACLDATLFHHAAASTKPGACHPGRLVARTGRQVNVHSILNEQVPCPRLYVGIVSKHCLTKTCSRCCAT